MSRSWCLPLSSVEFSGYVTMSMPHRFQLLTHKDDNELSCGSNFKIFSSLNLHQKYSSLIKVIDEMKVTTLETNFMRAYIEIDLAAGE